MNALMTPTRLFSRRLAASVQPQPRSVVRNPKSGLRASQVRMLRVLASSPHPLTRHALSIYAEIDQAWVGDGLYGYIADCPEDQTWISTPTPLGRGDSIRLGYDSLLGLGYVRGHRTEAGWVWTATAKGRKAAAKLDD